MDQNALKFIKDRQAVLRDAYNSYKLRFSSSNTSLASSDRHSNASTNSSEGKRIWAWGQWEDNDVNEIITECLQKEANFGGKPAAPEPNISLRDGIREWINELLSDTGSMFRLYRKAGFNIDNAIVALRDALEFRVQYRRELLWSPTPPGNGHEPSDSFKEISSLPSLTSWRRSSTSSRTSAQSPRASPALDSTSNTDSVSSGRTVTNNMQYNIEGSTETLIQLYPHSLMDPNRRPIIVVSLKYIESFSNSVQEVGHDQQPSPDSLAPPKTQALAAFERLRCYLADSASSDEEAEEGHLEPLQFILIIDLAGGRVSATAWEMVKWLVRDGADQFHGMCSSVFVVNYSWEFGAIWSFIKHMLPAPAKARVIFPKVEELVEYLGKDALPPSLRGSCTSILPYYSSPLTTLDASSSPAPPTPQIPSDHSPTPNGESPPAPHIPTNPTRARRTSLKYLPPTSHENPYYGYPATIEEGFDSQGRPIRIQYSRRRKRDLVKTLIRLLLLRCRERVASLPRQLVNMCRTLIRSRFSALLILVVTALVSLTRTMGWRRQRNRLHWQLAGRLT